MKNLLLRPLPASPLPGLVQATQPKVEAYFCCNPPEGQRVRHPLGETRQTRPPWSIHTGCGTSAHAIIWGMTGENPEHTALDAVPLAGL